MALWSNTDANTSAPKFVGAVTPVQAANGLVMYANTTPNVFVVGQNVGVFGVDTTEHTVSETSANHAQHAGWVLVRAGSGRRAGRFHNETLVAMGSMTGDGSPTANDDTTFADA